MTECVGGHGVDFLQCQMHHNRQIPFCQNMVLNRKADHIQNRLPDTRYHNLICLDFFLSKYMRVYKNQNHIRHGE